MAAAAAGGRRGGGRCRDRARARLAGGRDRLRGARRRAPARVVAGLRRPARSRRRTSRPPSSSSSSGSAWRSRACCSATSSAPSTRGARSAASRIRHARHAPTPSASAAGPPRCGCSRFTWLELASGCGEHPARLATAAAVYSRLHAGRDGRLRGRAVDRAAARPSASTSTSFAGCRPSRRATASSACGRCSPGCPARARPRARRASSRDDRHGHLRRPQRGRAVERERSSTRLGFGLGAHGVATRSGCCSASRSSPASTARHGRAPRRSAATSAPRAARAFVHSLVPIAAVYVAAHYLTFLVFEGQAISYLASDPLGQGWDLFGSARRASTTACFARTRPGTCRSAFVVAGHVAALVLAHDRALSIYGQAAAGRALAVLDARGSWSASRRWRCGCSPRRGHERGGRLLRLRVAALGGGDRRRPARPRAALGPARRLLEEAAATSTRWTSTRPAATSC